MGCVSDMDLGFVWVEQEEVDLKAENWVTGLQEAKLLEP